MKKDPQLSFIEPMKKRRRLQVVEEEPPAPPSQTSFKQGPVKEVSEGLVIETLQKKLAKAEAEKNKLAEELATERLMLSVDRDKNNKTKPESFKTMEFLKAEKNKLVEELDLEEMERLKLELELSVERDNTKRLRSQLAKEKDETVKTLKEEAKIKLLKAKAEKNKLAEELEQELSVERQNIINLKTQLLEKNEKLLKVKAKKNKMVEELTSDKLKLGQVLSERRENTKKLKTQLAKEKDEAVTKYKEEAKMQILKADALSSILSVERQNIIKLKSQLLQSNKEFLKVEAEKNKLAEELTSNRLELGQVLLEQRENTKNLKTELAKEKDEAVTMYWDTLYKAEKYIRLAEELKQELSVERESTKKLKTQLTKDKEEAIMKFKEEAKMEVLKSEAEKNKLEQELSVERQNINCNKTQLLKCAEREVVYSQTLAQFRIQIYKRNNEFLKVDAEKKKLTETLNSERQNTKNLKTELAKEKDEEVNKFKQEMQTEFLKVFWEPTELECSVCNEIFVEATTVNCGHTFCHYCLDKWQRNRQNSDCPLCRTEIKHKVAVRVLDEFLDKMYNQLASRQEQAARTSLKKTRAEARIKQQRGG